MKKPLVTVIISAYNHEKYVTKSIESIINQTYGRENIEIIAIDDCSKDQTAIILQKLSEINKFTFIRNKKNQGIAKNINCAIKMSRGKFICNCASDDYWPLDKLAIQVDFLEKNPNIGACGGNEIKVDQHNKIIHSKHQKFIDKQSYTFEDIFLINYHISTVTVMIPRKIYDIVGLYDETLLVEDLFMWLKITSNNFKIVTLNEILGYYRIHLTNVTSNRYLIYKEVLKILYDYQNHPLYPKALKRLKHFYFAHIAERNKLEAVIMIPDVFSASRYFFRGIYKLFSK